MSKKLSGAAGKSRPYGFLHRESVSPLGQYDSIGCRRSFSSQTPGDKTGRIFSLQLHHHRAEHWVVVSARPALLRHKVFFAGRKPIDLHPDPAQTPHRQSRQKYRCMSSNGSPDRISAKTTSCAFEMSTAAR